MLIALGGGLLSLSVQAQKNFPRNYVLVEKYTGENCLNCPSADLCFDYYIEEHPELVGKYIEIRHNSYDPDKYFLPWQKTLAETWGVEFYPQYRMDRCSFLGEKKQNPLDLLVPWDSMGWLDPITQLLSRPSYVSISLEGSTYSPETRELTVKLSGEVGKADLPDLCANVFLVQDDGEYENITRTFLTEDLNGDKLTVEDGTYEMTLRTTIAESYGVNKMLKLDADPSKMKVVAFISSFDDYHYPALPDGKDFTDSEVHNVDFVSVTALPASTPVCARPTIMLSGGKIVFDSTTPGATFDYTISPVAQTSEATAIEGRDALFTVCATASAQGYSISEPATATFSLQDLIESDNDANNDGLLGTDDVEAIAKIILQQ